MANSGIVWIDTVFNWCVKLLYDVAAIMGITYEEINVYLFVIIGPLFLLLSIMLNMYLLLRIRADAPTKNPYYAPKLLAQTHMHKLGRFY